MLDVIYFLQSLGLLGLMGLAAGAAIVATGVTMLAVRRPGKAFALYLVLAMLPLALGAVETGTRYMTVNEWVEMSESSFGPELWERDYAMARRPATVGGAGTAAGMLIGLAGLALGGAPEE